MPIIPSMPHEDYLAVKAASKSLLWTIHTKTPLHAVTARERTGAMDFGVAAHCAVLEPQHFTSRYARGPDDRRGAKWKDACEAAPAGVEILTARDYDWAETLGEDAAAHTGVQALLKGAQVEVSAFADMHGVKCKARPDAVKPGTLIDLKTTTDASDSAFRHTCHRFGYHVQEAWYCSVWRAAGGEEALEWPEFVFIVVESKPPFSIRLIKLDPAAVQAGWLIALAALNVYRECLEKNFWPGYGSEISNLSLDYRPAMGSEAEE